MLAEPGSKQAASDARLCPICLLNGRNIVPSGGNRFCLRHRGDEIAGVVEKWKPATPLTWTADVLFERLCQHLKVDPDDVKNNNIRDSRKTKEGRPVALAWRVAIYLFTADLGMNAHQVAKFFGREYGDFVRQALSNIYRELQKGEELWVTIQIIRKLYPQEAPAPSPPG